MGPEIIYVSGRTRVSGEMNGKSANLNNCLAQIYPAGVRIPATELACVFDADQARAPPARLAPFYRVCAHAAAAQGALYS